MIIWYIEVLIIKDRSKKTLNEFVGIAGYEKFVELMMNAGATDSSNKFDGVTPSFLATLNGR